MGATIHPKAIILTKVYRVGFGTIAKGCIVARIPPLKYFLFLLLKYNHMYNCIYVHRLGEYCNRNAPNHQYSPMVTSGG